MLGDLAPPDSAAFDNTFGVGAVLSEATFTLSNEAVASISTTISVTSSGNYTAGYLILLADGVQVADEKLTYSAGRYTAGLLETLGVLPAGEVYTVEVTGTSHTRSLSVSSNILTSGVPEPSTWAMMALGFAGLGYAAFRRNAKGRATAVAI